MSNGRRRVGGEGVWGELVGNPGDAAEHDRVDAGSEVGDGIGRRRRRVGLGLIAEAVGAGAAGQRVGSGPAEQGVVTIAAVDDVVAGKAIDVVLDGIAGQRIAKVTADNMLEIEQRVGVAETVGRRAGQEVDGDAGGVVAVIGVVAAGAAIEAVVAGAAAQIIVAVAADEDLIADAGDQLIRPRAAVEDADPGARRDGVGGPVAGEGDRPELRSVRGVVLLEDANGGAVLVLRTPGDDERAVAELGNRRMILVECRMGVYLEFIYINGTVIAVNLGEYAFTAAVLAAFGIPGNDKPAIG